MTSIVVWEKIFLIAFRIRSAESATEAAMALGEALGWLKSAYRFDVIDEKQLDELENFVLSLFQAPS